MIAFAFEQLQADDKPQALTEKLYGAEVQKAFITSEGNCRYRYDGGNPDKETGHILMDGSFIVLSGIQQIQMFRFVSCDIAGERLAISYERP